MASAARDQASIQEWIRRFDHNTTLDYCARKHDNRVYHFSRKRNYVLQYVHCSEWGRCDATDDKIANPKPDYHPHAIETSSAREAKNLISFLEAVTADDRHKEFWIDRNWFRKTVCQGGYNTRARVAKRNAHEQQIEQRLQPSAVDTSALASIRAMRDQGKKSPPTDWTSFDRLPNEILTMICRYAIEDTSCACPFCCDRSAIRRLYNLSTETRANLMKAIELNGNHAMRWFVGMDPASPTQAV